MQHTVSLPGRMLYVLALGGLSALLAQTGGPSTDELQKQTQNPVSNLISVPFQNNLNFPIGPFSREQNVLNIQPVIPVRLSQNWNLITRLIAPVVYQPNLLADDGGRAGFGDLNPTFFLSPAAPGKVIWGFGPAFLAPTATDSTLGQGKWGAGPSLVLLTQPKPWTIGVLMNNIWSFGGNEQRLAVNQGLAQYFINYNMQRGWYMGPSPIITVNWKQDPANRWIVPFGWSIGRVTKLGALPINAQVGAYYNLIHPHDLPYPKWQVRLQLALLFPKAQ